METTTTNITVETTVNAPLEKVWECWTNPEHIRNWNNASDDWYTPHAENDLREGGKFVYRMEARDGSMGFDFGGTYDHIKEKQLIEFTIGDGRKVKINFKSSGGQTKISENFETENMNPADLQKRGWQAILDNFKQYTETNQE